MKNFVVKVLLVLAVLPIGMFSCNQETVFQNEKQMAIPSEELIQFKSDFQDEFSKWVTALDNSIQSIGYENFKDLENLPKFQAEFGDQLKKFHNPSTKSNPNEVQTNLSPKVKEYISMIESVTIEAFQNFQVIDNSNLEEVFEGITLKIIRDIDKIELEAQTNTELSEVELLSIIGVTIAVKEVTPLLVYTGVEIAKTFINEGLDINSADVRGWFSELINTVVNIVTNNVVNVANFIGTVITQAFYVAGSILNGSGIQAIWNDLLGLAFAPVNLVVTSLDNYFGDYDCYTSPDLWNCP